MTPRELMAQLSEDDFLTMVIDRARARGWMVYHPRPARSSKGWRTPGQGTPVGFPDLVLARDGEVLIRELKSETGRVTDAQQSWLDACGGEVWRPSDWPRIVELLDGTGTTATAVEDIAFGLAEGWAR